LKVVNNDKFLITEVTALSTSNNSLQRGLVALNSKKGLGLFFKTAALVEH
jgi:hypothetical protein